MYRDMPGAKPLLKPNVGGSARNDIRSPNVSGPACEREPAIAGDEGA